MVCIEEKGNLGRPAWRNGCPASRGGEPARARRDQERSAAKWQRRAGPRPAPPCEGRWGTALNFNHSSKSLCPSAPCSWPGEPGGPSPAAGRAGTTEKGEQPVPTPGPLLAGLRRSPGSPQSGTRSEAARMRTDPARSPDRRVRAGEKESKLKCVRCVCLASRSSVVWQSPSQLGEPCGDRRLSVGTRTGGICHTECRGVLRRLDATKKKKKNRRPQFWIHLTTLPLQGAGLIVQIWKLIFLRQDCYLFFFYVFSITCQSNFGTNAALI